MAEKPIIIAGAGIAGLATALAGWDRDVLMLEKATAFEPVGAGLQLGPNAVSALKRLGAWDAVAPAANSPPEIHMRDGLSGKLLKRLQLGNVFERRFGAPYRTALRADLHSALLGVVQSKSGVEIRLKTQTESLLIHENGVTVTTDKGRELRGEGLIAADGVQSPLRQQIFAGTPPVDSGEVFHRALLHAWPELRDVDMSCINVWLMPGAHIVHYPVGHPRRLNVVVVTPRDQMPLVAVRDAVDCVKEFVAGLELSAPWPGLYVNPLPRSNNGHTLLVGDAAHATLPYLAQGAAMALEDAAELAHSGIGTLELASVFAKTSEARKDRTRRLHEASLVAGRNYHMAGLKAQARNMVLRALPDSLMWNQLGWLYHFKT